MNIMKYTNSYTIEPQSGIKFLYNRRTLVWKGLQMTMWVTRSTFLNDFTLVTLASTPPNSKNK